MKKELLVVSFGTSFSDSREKDIGSLEQALHEAFPDFILRRAFTSTMVIRNIQKQEGDKIDNVREALDRALLEGVQDLLVQPTHIISGHEYHKLLSLLKPYISRFASVRVGRPLLDRLGLTGEASMAEVRQTAEVLAQLAFDAAHLSGQKEAEDQGLALVYMGHGSDHEAGQAYGQLQACMQELDYPNVFIGAVEGPDQERSCQALIDRVAQAGYEKVILRALMVVAGDHAIHDMAGDGASWKNQFLRSGHFDQVDCQLEGLGRVPAIQAIYRAHAQRADLLKA